MDKDRWAKIAIEMQEHIDALEKIAKREKLDLVVVSLNGMPEDIYSAETDVLYAEGEVHYQSDKGADKKLSIRANNETYRTYMCA